MENNDYINFIKQAYEDKINLYERLIQEKEQTIYKQENEIIYLRKMVDKLLDEIKSIKEQLQLIEPESKSVRIEINNENTGGSMSNSIYSGSGDQVAGDKNNTYDFKGATFGGGLAQGDYTGDVTNNYPDKELDETVNKIHQLIEELSQKNTTKNTSDNMKIAFMVVEQIENNKSWKQKAIQACQKGLLEGIKSNPIGAFVAGAIEGWKCS